MRCAICGLLGLFPAASIAQEMSRQIGGITYTLPPAWGGVSAAMSVTFFGCAVLSCALLIVGRAPFARLASRM